jgi:hypothetical protein
MRHLITRHLQTNLAAPPLLFPRLFAWDTNVTLRVIDEMVQEGALQQVRVLKAPGLTSRAKPTPEGDVWVTIGE